jgi:hypothetical protein
MQIRRGSLKKKGLLLEEVAPFFYLSGTVEFQKSKDGSSMA